MSAVERSNYPAFTGPRFDDIMFPASALREGIDGGNWTDVDACSVDQLLAQMTPDNARGNFDSSTVRMAFHFLPFYDDVTLLRVFDPYWRDEDLVHYYLISNKKLFRLGGKIDQILEVNRTAPVLITENNVLEYLKFFCFFNRNFKRVLYMLDNLNAPVLEPLHGRPAFDDLQKLATPPRILYVHKGYMYLCEAFFLHKDAIFKGILSVLSSGYTNLEYMEIALDGFPDCIDPRV